TFSAEAFVKKYGSPLYVYDANIIRKRFTDLKNNITYPNLKLHFACKANTNPAILKLLKKEGSAIETVSPGEVRIARRAGYTTEDIVFTSSNISTEEITFLINNKILMNLDSLTQIEKVGKLKPNSKISVRLNQGIGA